MRRTYSCLAIARRHPQAFRTMTNPTTRRYPRTLADAFPGARADAFAGPFPSSRRARRLRGLALALVVFATVLLLG